MKPDLRHLEAEAGFLTLKKPGFGFGFADSVQCGILFKTA